jgi:hypothetical protein
MIEFDEKIADTVVRLKPSKYLRVNGNLYSGQLEAKKEGNKIINTWVSPEFKLPLEIAKKMADGNDPTVVILGAATVAKKEVEIEADVLDVPDVKNELSEPVESPDEPSVEKKEEPKEKPSRGRPKKTE